LTGLFNLLDYIYQLLKMHYTCGMRYNFKPVGTVSNEIKQPGRFHFDGTVSTIVLVPKYARALDGIEEFSHIVVIFWLDRIKRVERTILKTHPRRDLSLPLTGIFATRSPSRPNPIGVSTVKLLGVNANIITVMGLDAVDGTPVIDIKPYLPEPFLPSEVKLPSWTSVVQRHGT
jgi:tRNA-Thr(GGU) m(6)t(6)A37 methyltransferase TsaA